MLKSQDQLNTDLISLTAPLLETCRVNVETIIAMLLELKCQYKLKNAPLKLRCVISVPLGPLWTDKKQQGILRDKKYVQELL